MKEYQLQEHHYKGISKLQEYYGQKLSTSNEKFIIRWAEQCLERLSEIKAGQFYNRVERLFLNNCRDEYVSSKQKKSTPSF